MNRKPKLLIIGHGRHGKDTVCEILDEQYGYTFVSSSWFVAEHFAYEKFKDLYNYKNIEECYLDRHGRRSEWFDLISDYCAEDPARLGRDIFKKHDIYCGLRNSREFHSIKIQKLYDFCIWVDRSKHLPLEPKTSMDLEPWMADCVIDNNGSLDDLTLRVKELYEFRIKPFGEK